MKKSELATLLDSLQGKLRSFLRERGFRVRGRTFNRTTPDGLTDVVNFQMGGIDPPGTTYIPGLRENLYGRFTINLGIYVPEVARYHGAGEARAFVQDYYCCVRKRLGHLGPEHQELWWKIRDDYQLADELQEQLERDAFPFFSRFENSRCTSKRIATYDRWDIYGQPTTHYLCDYSCCPRSSGGGAGPIDGPNPR